MPTTSSGRPGPRGRAVEIARDPLTSPRSPRPAPVSGAATIRASSRRPAEPPPSIRQKPRAPIRRVGRRSARAPRPHSPPPGLRQGPRSDKLKDQLACGACAETTRGAAVHGISLRSVPSSAISVIASARAALAPGPRDRPVTTAPWPSMTVGRSAVAGHVGMAAAVERLAEGWSGVVVRVERVAARSAESPWRASWKAPRPCRDSHRPPRGCQRCTPPPARAAPSRRRAPIPASRPGSFLFSCLDAYRLLKKSLAASH